VRLLLFSDLHLDAPGTETSTVELRAAFERIGQLARDLKVDAVCSAGNLYDQNDLAHDTADVLWNGFAGINPIPVFLVPGSSDWYSPGSLYAKPWSNNVQIFTQAHLTPLTIANGVTLWGAAHIAPTQPLGFLASGDVRPAGVNLALFHGCERAEFDEQRMDGPLTAPFHAHQIRQAGFDHALVGHLPAPKAEADYTYPGRPRPRRADGSPAGGAVLVTVHSDGSVDQQWHDLFGASPYAKAPERTGFPSQDNVSDDPAPSSPAALRAWPPPAEPRAQDPQPATVSELFSKGNGAPPVAPAASAPIEEERDPFDTPEFAESTVRGQFIRSIRRGELSRADQNRVLSIGLAAIDGQSDFGEL
jgi:DNA repair exonuclease SbcCD nuclease subunit